MDIKRIFKAIATVLCLALGIGRRSVSCDNDLEPLIYDEPSSLKDILDFLGKLGTSTLKSQVIEELDSRVTEFFTPPGIQLSSGKKTYEKVFDKVSELRSHLLKKPDNYGRYACLDLTDDFIEEYATFLIDWLPILHNELWFLHYQIATDCTRIGGHKWYSNAFGRSPSNTQLHRWLTVENKVPLVRKNFEDRDLKRNPGTRQITANTGIDLFGGGPLNHAQYGLFLIQEGEFHPSNLANAVLFIDEFCSVIEAQAFKARLANVNHEQLSAVCLVLTRNFSGLTRRLLPLYYARIQVSSFRSDRNGYNNIYTGKLKPDKVEYYVNWLRRNLSGLVESLTRMLSESSQWIKWNNVKDDQSPGPFKYGFIYKEEHWNDANNHELRLAISKLTHPSSGSLRALLETLKYDLPTPDASEDEHDKDNDSMKSFTESEGSNDYVEADDVSVTEPSEALNTSQDGSTQTIDFGEATTSTPVYEPASLSDEEEPESYDAPHLPPEEPLTPVTIPNPAAETSQGETEYYPHVKSVGQGNAQCGVSAGGTSLGTEPSSQVPKQEQGQVNPSTGTTTQDQATEAPASGAGAASTAGAEGVQSEESRETSGGDSKEPANLRPAGGESKPKGSSFTSTPFVGCFVTLGFLISMI